MNDFIRSLYFRFPCSLATRKSIGTFWFLQPHRSSFLRAFVLSTLYGTFKMKTRLFFRFTLLCALGFSIKGFSQTECTNTLTATNLIVNGDFEGPVTGNESDYSYKSGGASGPGSWGVGQAIASGSSYRPTTVNGQPGDHTLGTTAGHYMLIDVNEATNKFAWKSTVVVQPNTMYFFSCYIANVNSKNRNPSQLKFYVGSTDISNGTIITPPGLEVTDETLADHSWKQFYTSWFSGSTSGPITVSMKNLLEDGTGNDLALDDITFSTSCKWVTQLEQSHFPNKVSVCDGQPITLNPGITGIKPADKFVWTKDSPSGAVVQTGNNQAYTVPGNTFGKYYLCYVVNSCARLDTAEIVNAPILFTAKAEPPAKCGDNGKITLLGLIPLKSYTVSYTYVGSPVTNTLTADHLGNITISGKKGTYADIQVAANGCTSNKQSVTLSDPLGPVIYIDPSDISQPSNCTSLKKIRVSGTSGLTKDVDYSVSYFDGTKTVTLTVTATSSEPTRFDLIDLLPGTYSQITVTDEKNCKSNPLTQDLIPPGLPTLTATASPAGCGTNDGKLNISATGLTSGKNYDFTYTLAGVTKTVQKTTTGTTLNFDIADLAAGTYTGIAASLSGQTCGSNVVSATVTEPPKINGSVSTTPICAGNTAIVTLAGPTGGPSSTYTYQWQESTDSSAASWTNFTGTGAAGKSITTPILTTVGKRYYRVVVTSGTCSQPFAIGVAIRASPSISGPLTGVVCSGMSYESGAITATPATGVTFDWSRATVTGISNAAANGTSVALATGITETLSNTTTGSLNVTYVLTPKTATCTGTPVNLMVSVTQKPSITAPTTGSICTGSEYVSGALTTNPATGVSFDWSRAVVADISNTLGSGTNVASATGISETLTTTSTTPKTAKYVLIPKVGTCTGTPFNLNVVVNPAPYATLSGGGLLCKDAAPNLTVTLTGSPSFTLDYTDATGAIKTITSSTNTASLPVVAGKAGDYTLTKVTDNNCSQSLNAKQTISIVPDLIYTAGTATCNYTTKEATVTFAISGGVPAYSVAPNNGSFTGNTYSVTFPAIGNTLWEYKASDNSNCPSNQNLQASKGNIDCACSVTGKLTLKPGSNATICSGGTTQIQMTVAGSALPSPNYSFTIVGPNGFSKTQTQATSVVGNDYTFDIKDTGTYSIQTVADPTCTGVGTGQPHIAFFPTAKASINALEPDFCQNGTDAGKVGISIDAPSKANYSITLARSGLADTLLTLTGNNTSFDTKQITDYTLKSLTDGNGCPSPVSDLTGKASIVAVTLPVARITAPVPVISPATDNFTFNANPLVIEATDPSVGYTGKWSLNKVAGTGVPVLGTLSSSFANSVSGMDFEDHARLTWSVEDVSGECPTAVATVDLFRKNATQPKVDDDSVCLSAIGSYVLKGNGLVTGETGSWTYIGSVSGVTVSLVAGTNGKNATVSGVILTTELEFEYSVASTVPGVTSSPDRMKLKIQDKPLPGAIDGSDPLCENGSSMYSATGFTSNLPTYTYAWSAIPSGTSNAQATSSTNANQVSYLVKSTQAHLGKKDSVEVRVEVSNACGMGFATKKVVFGLKPRTLDQPLVRDTIEGPKAFCESSKGVRWRFLNLQSQATHYVWEWDGQVQTMETDTSVLILPAQWTGKQFVKVKVTLQNACGVATSNKAMDSLQVEIIKAKPFQISLTPITSLGVGSTQFCVPTETPTFKTSIVQPIGIDVLPKFEWWVDGVVQQPLSYVDTFTPTSPLVDGGVVEVKGEADLSACVTIRNDSKKVVMEGFMFPDSTIHPSALKICEDKEIRLEVYRTQNKSDHYNDTHIAWYKNGVLQPQHTGYAITLGDPSESGKYTVALQANVCQHVTKQLDTTHIQIYQKPDFVFAQNPFVVEYQNGLKVPMPVVVLTHPDSIKASIWESSVWLENPLITFTHFLPEKEEVILDYTLTLVTGDLNLPGSQCSVTKPLRVYNVLPLTIPNAFSPNGDGKNETWMIQGMGKYPNSHVKVFNRWGNALFTDNYGYLVPWDGNCNGAPLPSGTYYYVIDLKGSPDNTDTVRTGSLTIVR